MIRKLIFSLLVLLWIASPSVAYAGPFAALIPIAVGFLKVSAAVKLAITVAASVAVSMLTKQKAQRPAGIMLEHTATGGTVPRTAIFGVYGTAGSLVGPPMSYGNVNKTPNAYLVKVVAIADVPITSLARLIINGEYVPLTSTGAGTYAVGGKYAGKANLRFHNGSQTVADSFLTSTFSTYPNRPWTSSRVGKGVAYGVLTFEYDAEVYKGEPDIRFEVYGAALYDPRFDGSVGGTGPQRWGQPATYAFTENPIVMVYNILRGLALADGTTYGGKCSFDELPLANWVAAMNVCDELVDGDVRYKAALEFSLDDEPADVIEELLKASSSLINESGGVYKVRTGPPSLPVLFISDDDFLVSEPRELDPFPGIHAAHNTIRAVYPNPEEVWQQHDAPAFTNPAYIARDNGIELVADLQFPACPFPLQVQRNMRAWLEDDQRLAIHSGTLPHHFFALEPLDTVAWTSARNGYVNKWFEVTGAPLNLSTLNSQVMMREVDPSDYDWDEDMELPDPVSNGDWFLPAVQAVPGFAVEAWSIKDDDSDARRPAIRALWDVDGATDAMALRIEVRLAASGDSVAGVTVANVGAGQQIISEGILPATSYEVRARYLVDRPTDWTVWHGVTTGNILLTGKDFDFDALVEALGESVVLPAITRPLKAALIEELFDSAFNDIKQRRQDIAIKDAFVGIAGNTASIINETIQRLSEDEALTVSLNSQIARIDDNAAAIVNEQVARADADTALASSITALTADVNDNTAAILDEATARADADGVLAGRITSIEANYTTDADITAAVASEALARANADTALGTRIDTVTASVGDNAAAITDEAVARAAADGALAGRVSTIEASYVTEGDVDATVTAAVSVEASARASADTALAGSITTVTTRLDNAGGSGVTVEQSITAQGSAIDGLEGQYTVRINNNGKISGFGLASGAGGTSEFAVLADRFIITDPANNSTQAYPFQVVGGAVYIRKALIQTITAEQIGANQITADKISVNNLQAVSVNVGDLDINPTVSGGTGRIRVFDESGVLRVVLGRL